MKLVAGFLKFLIIGTFAFIISFAFCGVQREKPIIEDYALPYKILMPQSSDKVVFSSTENKAGTAYIDYGNAEDGYVIVSCQSKEKAVFQLNITKKGETVNQINYPLSNEGKPEVCPLIVPEAQYEMKVFINSPLEGDNIYYSILANEIYVSLQNEFLPFLIPSKTVDYTSESETVEIARKLVLSAKNHEDAAAAIVNWVAQNIVYDSKKANALDEMKVPYTPETDEVLTTKSGICYDFAVLTATMMRAIGIPCKVVKGYVNIEDSEQYHAWNEIYLEEKGWIIIDTTFCSSKNHNSRNHSMPCVNSDYLPILYE